MIRNTPQKNYFKQLLSNNMPTDDVENTTFIN